MAGPRWPHACLRPFLGCLALPFSRCCLTFKESGLGLVTRAKCFKRVIMKAASEGMRLEYYFFHVIFGQSESRAQPRFKGWKHRCHLFTGDSNNLWSCLMYHKCQYTLPLIFHSLVAREFLKNLFSLENIHYVSIFYFLSFCIC